MMARQGQKDREDTTSGTSQKFTTSIQHSRSIQAGFVQKLFKYDHLYHPEMQHDLMLCAV